MRTLILSSLSILGGLTTAVHAQHWVPYSFYSFKQTQPKTEAKKETKVETPSAATAATEKQRPEIEQATEGMIASAEAELHFIVDSELAYQNDSNSTYYADPELRSTRSGQKPKEAHTCTRTCEIRKRICSENWWVEGDYLLAWMKKGHIRAPLITTGSIADPVPGAIGQPGTSVVFGDENYNFHRTSGVRAAFGGYLGTNHAFSFDIGGFWIFSREKHFHISSDASGSPLIARPFFDVRTGTEDAEFVSDPGFFSGSSTALVKTNFWGAEVNFGYRPCSEKSTCGNVFGDFFFGFRYLRLFEKIRVRDDMIPIATPSGLTFNGITNAVNPPDKMVDEDEFRANNDFFGGQIGLKSEFAVNCWLSFDIFAKVALGATEEKYKTDGSTTWESTTFGDQYACGGVLVQPNNMEHIKKWRLAWVPEAGINLGIRPFDHLRFLVGYSFLWWSRVVRPGEQMNRNVNSGQIARDPAYFTPAMQKPQHHIKHESFWLQSVNFGVMFDF